MSVMRLICSMLHGSQPCPSIRQDDALPAVSTTPDVVHRAGILNAQLTRPGATVATSSLYCQEK